MAMVSLMIVVSCSVICSASNTALRIDFARAQHRMGKLYDLLGDHLQARLAFAEAIDLFDQLRAERPDDPQLTHDLAASYTMLGGIAARNITR